MSISFGVVLLLFGLILQSVLCGTSTAANAYIRVLRDILVGLLGSLMTSALDGL